ncbi:3-hydroxyacyl-ACP dehydratase [Mucilaginibacter sp.]|jgi:predicted hotdog family 3-hydroxylacyl-ACP dehydratase|uniref:3-hydroxyacyl-ACP dehydratase n=1 Tax=Mucilaginibacter sp. TaxID=1882438 RepID=UPI00261BA968|nr:3-hydroxyacyl-ACP dehydratase [Mucilaginibacter sp.]MDB5130111.1 3-hydroxyacyl-ACP dehydratase [Mucilaginibacter sp.]
MEFPIEDITALIPQKYPFVFVDKLLYADDSLTRSSFVIKPGAVFVKGDLLQEAGLMENIAQTAALQAGYMARKANEPVKKGYIGNVKNLEVLKLPKVNEEITTEVSMGEQIFNVIMITGKISLGDEVIASCEMKVFADN